MRAWLTGNILTGFVLGLSVSALWLGLDGSIRPAFAESRGPSGSSASHADSKTASAPKAVAKQGDDTPRNEVSNEDSAARLKAWIAQSRPAWEARRNAQNAGADPTATGQADTDPDGNIADDSGAGQPARSDTIRLIANDPAPAVPLPAAPPADDRTLSQSGIMQTVAGSPLASTGQAAGTEQSEAVGDNDNNGSDADSIQTAAGNQYAGMRQIADSGQAAGDAGPAPAGSGQSDKPANQQANDDKTVHLIADEAGYDQDLGLYVARGHVQVRRGDKTTFADTVAYNERTKRITASGHVAVLEPTGDTMFGDYVDISDDFSNGAFEGFRALMADKSRLAANTATKTDDTHMQFHHAVYTPCLPCQTDPTRTPLWQIKAKDAYRDEDEQTITYHDAWMEMWGVPVFYTPWFRHPDIGVDRQSGLLTPGFSYSSKGGFQLRQPYFLTLGDDKDLTITPIFRYGGNPEKNPGAVGMLLYRQRIEDGNFSLGGSMTVEDRPVDSDNGGVVKDAFRGHLQGDGLFNLNEDWRAGFDFKVVTDKDYLRRYHLGSARWLQDQAYTEGFFGRSYASAWAYAFQSTRTNLNNNDAPFVTPKLDYNFLSEPGWADSTWAVDFDTMNILRRQDGDQYRIAASPSFTLPYTSPFGDIYKLTVSLDTALYAANDIDPNFNEHNEADTSFSGVKGRVVPKASFTWRYPFVRASESFSQVIEPIVQLVGAPDWGNSNKIANNDSRFFDLDDTRLFSANRFVGLDRYDTGSRATYGLNWTGYLASGGQANVFLGQSYQFTRGDRDQDLTGTGIDTDFTDIVGRATLSPNQYLDLSYRFRYDVNDESLKRQEALVTAGPQEFNVSVSYIELNNAQDIDLTNNNNDTSNRREFVSLGVNSKFGQYWSLGTSSTYDLEQSEISQIGGILNYLDECFGMSLSVYYDPSDSSETTEGKFSGFFSVTFKNLGALKTGI